MEYGSTAQNPVANYGIRHVKPPCSASRTLLFY